MRSDTTTITAAATRPTRFRFEQLEDRVLRSVASPTPGDGNDYFFATNAANDAAPVVTASPEVNARKALPGGFKWYDGTWAYGLRALSPNFGAIMINGYDIWPQGPKGALKHGANSESGTRAIARQAAATNSVLVIDIEEWAMDVRSYGKEQVDVSLNRFKQVLGWIRSEAPTVKLGIYGFMPLSDDAPSTKWAEYEPRAAINDVWYVSALPIAAHDYAQWQAAGAYIGAALSPSVDYIFPSIYTGSADPAKWERYAATTILEARRYGKPVVPFIWPKFHDAVPNVGGTLVPQSMWQFQLDTVRKYADGGIIWNGMNQIANPLDTWVQMSIAAAAQTLLGGLGLGGGGGTGDGTTGDDVLGSTPSPFAAGDLVETTPPPINAGRRDDATESIVELIEGESGPEGLDELA